MANMKSNSLKKRRGQDFVMTKSQLTKHARTSAVDEIDRLMKKSKTKKRSINEETTATPAATTTTNDDDPQELWDMYDMYDACDTGYDDEAFNVGVIDTVTETQVPRIYTRKNRKQYWVENSEDVKRWYLKSFEINGHADPCLKLPNVSSLGDAYY
ncbi:hypothetical protein, partial, partial [Parasitella parasitica]